MCIRDRYRWRNNGIKLFPTKHPLVRKTTYICQCEDGTTDSFKRITYQFLSDPSRTVVQYLGSSSVTIPSPHGNRVHDDKVYIRSCPSVLVVVVVACTDYGCVAPCLANILQNVRFWAASLASGSPMSKGERSSVMFRIQVERGRPGSLLQFSGSCSNRTRLASADSSIRARCPNRESGQRK